MDYDKLFTIWNRHAQMGYPSPYVIRYEGQEFPMHLPPGEDYISRIIVGTESFYDIGLLEHIRKNHNKQATIVDVGANIGNHARYFESFLDFEQIVCFEPDTSNYELLKQNIFNYKTIAVHAAVGDYNGRVAIRRDIPDNCGSGKVVGGDEVNQMMLDSTSLSNVTMLKIDVEGREFDVLKGGIGTLIKWKPLIYIEMVERETDCRAFLASLGYVQTGVFWTDGVASHEFTHLEKFFAPII